MRVCVRGGGYLIVNQPCSGVTHIAYHRAIHRVPQNQYARMPAAVADATPAPAAAAAGSCRPPTTCNAI